MGTKQESPFNKVNKAAVGLGVGKVKWGGRSGAAALRPRADCIRSTSPHLTSSIAKRG